ncbi:hypothetical protein [Arthrobacter sp. HMSC08H08]|uniref:hypothetical protein n=1 Tax=Arthrobacter sp. HMSC08H08 TaxID=1581143 RepID=UPI000B09E0E7|nr:hypothetical protein [Arthrobacter sp. HMSC08H08]
MTNRAHEAEHSFMTPNTPALNQRITDGLPEPAQPFDPLRLCIFATIALLTCIFGPLSLLFFSILGIRGYAKARREGLMKSKCKLGDTKRVIAYLTTLAVLAAALTPLWVMAWIKIVS